MTKLCARIIALCNFFYHTDSDSRPIEEQTSHWIALMGTLFLEIRKSMGNDSTQLDRWEMIEWFLSDAAKMKAMHEKNHLRTLKQ